MIVRRFFIAVMAATLFVGSCGGDPPPPPPAPPGPDMDSLRAYQDSVRAAEEEARRLAAEEADGPRCVVLHLAEAATAVLRSRVHLLLVLIPVRVRLLLHG